VDISAPAIALAKANVHLNFPKTQVQFFVEDVFDFLTHRECDYDLAILDPPAFAKKKKDIPSAIKGYKRLFKQAMERLPSEALLLLSSCSYYISTEMFERIIHDAALEAHRTPRIIGRHRHAIDHPINLFHPESEYLKSVLLAL
ncbi:MAG: methyltransferase, partial [Chlamydiia bacterium]|nr:methyltransferase [Chlamydiia bacterium]